MTANKFSISTKNLFQFHQERNEALLLREKALRDEAVQVMQSAAMTIGKLLDEINAMNMGFKVIIHSMVSLSVYCNEYSDLHSGQMTSEVQDLVLSLYKGEHYSYNLQWCGSKYDIETLRNCFLYEEKEKEVRHGTNAMKKEWKKFNSMLQDLFNLNNQWKQLKTASINYRVEIVSENDVSFVEIY